MPGKLSDDEAINELLELTGLSAAHPKARGWIGSALAASQALAAQKGRPPPAKYNAPLDVIEQATCRLINSVIALRRDRHPHGDFWRSGTFGPFRDPNFETPAIMSTLE